MASEMLGFPSHIICYIKINQYQATIHTFLTNEYSRYLRRSMSAGDSIGEPRLPSYFLAITILFRLHAFRGPVLYMLYKNRIKITNISRTTQLQESILTFRIELHPTVPLACFSRA